MTTPKRQRLVLVVDDEPAIAELVSQTLAAVGYQVSIATDGTTAESLLRSTPFDVVITDMLMPNVDGAQLLLLVRRLRPTARVIAMSGGGANVGAGDALVIAEKLGATTVLQKPFSTTALIDCVDECP